MRLSEYIDIERLRRHIAHGVVTARRHNTLPLTIYCYGKKAVFDQIWDDVTTKTRGLIVDDSGEIIARPYEKFFSVDQFPALLSEAESIESQYGPPTITEKVNGCLGIFWKYGIHWGIASKGSFHSPHAEFATKWMEQHIEELFPLVFPEGYTPVFEIICQEVQPHVIKYPKDGLVLLSFVNIETGEELDDTAMHGYGSSNYIPVTNLVPLTLEDALAADNDYIEGYVATYNIPGKAPFKLKIKFPTFLKNRKAFYAEERLKTEPEKTAKYTAIHDKAVDIVKEALISCTEQKEFAAFFTRPENVFYAPVCFAMLNYDNDKERQKRAIWRLVDKQANFIATVSSLVEKHKENNAD